MQGSRQNIDAPNNRQQDAQPDQPTRQEGAASPTHRTVDSNARIDTSTSRPNRQERVQNSGLRGSYTQIMVNPMQLSDVEFTKLDGENWLRQERTGKRRDHGPTEISGNHTTMIEQNKRSLL